MVLVLSKILNVDIRLVVVFVGLAVANSFMRLRYIGRILLAGICGLFLDFYDEGFTPRRSVDLSETREYVL